MKKITTSFILVIALSIISCSGGDDSSDPATPPSNGGGTTVDKPTYTSNIKPIIDGKCISCHGPGGEKSDVPFTSYDLVKARATDIKTRIEKPAGDPQVMPKGGKLPQSEIDLINKWISTGMLN